MLVVTIIMERLDLWSYMSNTSIKHMVKDGKMVFFKFYRHSELHYETQCGFEFVVPIEDCGDAVFLNEDKAILFMRYIRKQLEKIEQGRKETANV